MTAEKHAKPFQAKTVAKTVAKKVAKKADKTTEKKDSATSLKNNIKTITKNANITNTKKLKTIENKNNALNKPKKQQAKQKQNSEADDFDNKQKIKQALIKKALGFVHNEVVEEFVFSEDGEVKLSKRRVTKKFSPPDIPAAKVLLESFDHDNQDFSQMTTEQLKQEKQRLIKKLKDL